MPFKDQQFTYYNIVETENFLRDILAEISLLFKAIFNKEKTAALILIGEYGKGEGGIIQINELYRPHNNLDLLYIYNGRIDLNLINLADKQLQQLANQYNIGIKMSAINKEKLLSLNGLVISYDIRNGHKTILGNSTFLKEHKIFSVYNIVPTDVRQLLVNHGTLLLVNKLLFQKKILNIEEKKLIIKHIMKAIIGYCDALLYFHNCYHWSYAQKEFNMTVNKNIDNKIKELYSEAILFRFMPDYQYYLKKDLKKWQDEILNLLSTIHLTCEKINLSEKDLYWEIYFNTALEKQNYIKQKLHKKIKTYLYGISNIGILKELNSSSQILSFMQSGNIGMLVLLFPYIAYEVYPRYNQTLLKKVLQSKYTSSDELLKRYLTLWSKYRDTDFENLITNIKLDKK